MPSATTSIFSVAPGDDRAHDLALLLLELHARDERAVDLQAVEREALQRAQARVARAEVVDQQADAEVAQRVQALRRSRACAP
jgi:hypothetical protein